MFYIYVFLQILRLKMAFLDLIILMAIKFIQIREHCVFFRKGECHLRRRSDSGNTPSINNPTTIVSKIKKAFKKKRKGIMKRQLGKQPKVNRFFFFMKMPDGVFYNCCFYDMQIWSRFSHIVFLKKLILKVEKLSQEEPTFSNQKYDMKSISCIETVFLLQT